MITEEFRNERSAQMACGLILTLTVAQLFVATFATGLAQFEGKAFWARLIAYPVLMLAAPLCYWLGRRRTGSTGPLPWSGFALIMAPFLIDVTGNTLNLYDSVSWWDDLNHFVNWLLLSAGIGVLLSRSKASPPWTLGWLVVGIGAILAIGWEIAEWYTFVGHGPELATAYRDTMGDEFLGTLGAAVAGVWITYRRRQALRATGPCG